MINTAYIKKHVTCHQCNGTNLVRRVKQQVVSTVNSEGEIIAPTKLNWRVFECKDCEYSHLTHTLDDKTQLVHDEVVALPFTCFDYAIEPFNDDYINFSLWLNEKVGSTDTIPHDDLRDDHVRYLDAYFRRRGMSVANSMECVWEVTFSPCLGVSSVEEGIKIVRSALEASGAKWHKELEEQQWEDNDELPEWKDGMWDEIDFKPLIKVNF